MPLKYTVKKRGNKAKMKERPISLNRANGLLWFWVLSTGRKLAVKGGCVLHFHDEVSVGHELHTLQALVLPVIGIRAISELLPLHAYMRRARLYSFQ